MPLRLAGTNEPPRPALHGLFRATTTIMADALSIAVLPGHGLSGWPLKNFRTFPLATPFQGEPLPESPHSSTHSSSSSCFQVDSVCLLLEPILTQPILKVLGILTAAPHLSEPLCLPWMPSLSVPNPSNPMEHRAVLSLCGCLEASSLLGLREGDTQPLTAVRDHTAQ